MLVPSQLILAFGMRSFYVCFFSAPKVGVVCSDKNKWRVSLQRDDDDDDDDEDEIVESTCSFKTNVWLHITNQKSSQQQNMQSLKQRKENIV